jgi:hypothetical protein
VLLKLKNKACQINAGSAIENNVFRIAVVIPALNREKSPLPFISALQQPGHLIVAKK